VRPLIVDLSSALDDVSSALEDVSPLILELSLVIFDSTSDVNLDWNSAFDACNCPSNCCWSRPKSMALVDGASIGVFCAGRGGLKWTVCGQSVEQEVLALID
jgi:hypothetical protein